MGSLNFMRLSLKERRTRGPVESCVQEIRGISLVFGEMWDTAGLPLKLVAGERIHGCPILRVLREGWDSQISP